MGHQGKVAETHGNTITKQLQTSPKAPRNASPMHPHGKLRCSWQGLWLGTKDCLDKLRDKRLSMEWEVGGKGQCRIILCLLRFCIVCRNWCYTAYLYIIHRFFPSLHADAGLFWDVHQGIIVTSIALTSEFMNNQILVETCSPIWYIAHSCDVWQPTRSRSKKILKPIPTYSNYITLSHALTHFWRTQAGPVYLQQPLCSLWKTNGLDSSRGFAADIVARSLGCCWHVREVLWMLWLGHVSIYPSDPPTHFILGIALNRIQYTIIHTYTHIYIYNIRTYHHISWCYIIFSSFLF